MADSGFVFLCQFFCLLLYVVEGQDTAAAPSITLEPKDIVVQKNGHLNLECRFTGKPTPTVHWLHNGKPVPTDNNDPESRRFLMPYGDLTFLRVVHKPKRQKSDSGIYQCVVTNRHGTVKSRNATFEIGALKSTFKKEPQNQNAIAGERVVLECSPPKGRPEPTVSWLKDRKKLQLDSRVSVDSTGNLIFKIVEKSDEGSYICQATNLFGQKKSSPARLSVTVPPVNTLVIKPKEKTAQIGDSVTFSCHYRKKGFNSGIVWKKKGGTLPVGRHSAQGGQLSLSDIQKEDKGTYECSIITSSGLVTAEAKLIMHSKPWILQKPKDQIVTEGGNVTFNCKAAGVPQPTVFWSGNGKHMFPSQNYGRLFVTSSGQLKITDVKKGDAGNYLCSAVNSAGLVARGALAVLTVKGAFESLPAITAGPTNKTVIEGSETDLTCEVSGSPKPVVKWYKKGSLAPLLNSSKFLTVSNQQWTQLIIRSVNVADTGIYACEAVNKLGTASNQASLAVQALKTTVTPKTTVPQTTTPLPLSPPSELFVLDVNSSAVVLLWSSVTPPSGVAVTYIVEYKEPHVRHDWKAVAKHIRSNRFTVPGLAADKEYMFAVRSVTDTGERSTRTKISKPVRTLKSKKPISIGNPLKNIKLDMSLIPASEDSIHVTWESPKPLRHVTGFYIYWEKRGTGSNSGRKVVINSKAKGKTLYGLEPNSTYKIRVEAYYGHTHKSLSSEPKYMTTLGKGVVSQVPMHAQANGSSSIVVQWVPPKVKESTATVKEYQIWCLGETSEQSINITVEGKAPTLFVITNLTPGKKYNIKVSAISVKGAVLESNVQQLQLEEDDAYGGVPDVLVIGESGQDSSGWSKVKSFVSQPWFIGTVGAVVWVILFVIALLLWRKRKRKQELQKKFRPRSPRVPVHGADVPLSPSSLSNSRILWLEERNKEPPVPLANVANNRVSDNSSNADCGRQVTSCCNPRGGGSNSSIEFPNKITVNAISVSRLAEHDVNQYNSSSNSRKEKKPNNLEQSGSRYDGSLHKNNFGEYTDLGTPVTPSQRSVSGSDRSLAKSQTRESPAQFSPYSEVTFRNKSSPFTRLKRDYNRTPSESSDTDKTKPKLKIQSFEVSGNVNSSSTFHSEPPPSYEESEMLKLKERERRRAMIIESQSEREDNDKDTESNYEMEPEKAQKEKEMPKKERVIRSSSPVNSERSYTTNGSRKRTKLKPPPKLAILNWADFLPGPPSHPPPSSLGSPPPSPPYRSSAASMYSERSAMTGMSGTTGMSGMTGMSDASLPYYHKKAARSAGPGSVVSDSMISADAYTSELERAMAESVASKSEKGGGNGGRRKNKPIPIDLEGITSDIIMQWADSVTNTSGSDEESECSSPSRISGISDGSFFTDADFANAVKVAAECGGFNMDTIGLMDSLGIPTYGSWKRNKTPDTPTSTGAAAAVPEKAFSPKASSSSIPKPRNPRNRWETGSEGNIEHTPTTRVRPRFRRGTSQDDNSERSAPVGEMPNPGFVSRVPVPIVPSQPRRPIPRSARGGVPPVRPPPQGGIVQPLKKTSALGKNESRGPVKKFAVVRQIPHSKDSSESGGGYSSNTMSSSTSTASTVKSSSCAPSHLDDSDESDM